MEKREIHCHDIFMISQFLAIMISRFFCYKNILEHFSSFPQILVYVPTSENGLEGVRDLILHHAECCQQRALTTFMLQRGGNISLTHTPNKNLML